MIRYEFNDENIREADVHPDSVFSRERELAQDFVEHCLNEGTAWSCPVCGGERREALFSRWGREYALCANDWSLALRLKPDVEDLRRYFTDSDLARFRAGVAYQDTASRLRKGLWESQADWIAGRIHRYLGHGRYRLVDWGGKYLGWPEVLRRRDVVAELQGAESLSPLGVEVPDAGGEADVVCMMDVVQRSLDPGGLLRRAAGRLRPGGLLILTSRSGSGFDILTLREASESVYPFDHVLLPSPEGVRRLLKGAGLDLLELSTPGLLDAQIVSKAREQIPHDQRFQRYLLAQADEALLERLQAFLQQNNLSSHLRAIARKPAP